jgi:hypothetical protein
MSTLKFRGDDRPGLRDIGLLLGRLLCFDHSVLAKDSGASLSTLGSVTAGQNGVAAFVTTHWSMVL